MPITQEITNLLNGVSQAPPHLRDPSQGEEQVNVLDHRTRGKRVRPPTEHLAKLSSDVYGYDTAYDFTLDRSALQRFRFIVANGDVKAYNIDTGAVVPIFFPFGKSYLSGSSFRSTTIGDKIVLLNRAVATAKDTAKKSPDSTPQALIHVKAADYETLYTVTINDVVYSYKTPASSAPGSRSALGTDQIAAALYSRISSQLQGLTVTQFGSVIHLEKSDGSDFAISCADGLGGIALSVIKGSVQLFSDLPLKGKSGMVVEVVGSPESDADNYFVQYDDSGSPEHAGVWKEVIKPGLLTGLTATTMPHVLEYQGSIFGDTVGQGSPKLPTLGTGGSTEIAHGFTSLNNVTGIDPDQPFDISTHNDFLLSIPAEFDGTQKTVRVMYDIDATGATDDTVEVRMFVGGVLRASLDHTAYINGPVVFNQTLEWTGSPAPGDQIKLQIVYLLGATAATPTVLTVHSAVNVDGPGVLLISNQSAKYTLDPAYKYPAGLTLTATLDGTPFAYAVGAADQTGAQVATGLAALIDADAGFIATSPASGVVLARTSGGAVPTAAVTHDFNELTTFHAPTLAMIPGDHVGSTIRNVTDSSSGIITANTATTVTVTALSGGADNKFQPGDSAAIFDTDDYFVLSPAVWSDRTAGDNTTAPFPEFVGRAIDEVFFYQNRLGFTSRDEIVLSAVGDYFNVFRTTVTQLLDSDVIDVRSSVRKVTGFNGAVEWSDGLYLASDQDVFRLSGSPALTPSSVRLDFMGQYQSHPNVRPLALPGRLVLASVKNDYTRVAFAALVTRADDTKLDFTDTTVHVPAYIAGNPIAMACDPKAQLLFVVTDGGARRSVYVCAYHIEDDRFVQLSWSRWDLPFGAIVVGIDVLNGIVGLVIKRTDGAYLEAMTLDPAEVVLPELILLDGTMRLDGTFYLDSTPL